MQLAPGTSLAHYELSAPLGKGGMGEVWRAKDTRLGRDVAIKFLPEEFTRDVERLARFEREARVLASLNHPHVASIYEIGQAVVPSERSGSSEALSATSSASARVDSPVHYIAMELAPGEELSTRLRRGPIPVEEAIAIAAQIADALEAAHAKGIIHRDLKPANVKLSDDSNVKLLDFGLAKALEADDADPELSNSPTMVRAATHAGVILGTAAYMSPEQARGKKVDSRADVWAFGAVFFEMLTGTRLFTGETVSDTLASVLTRNVEFSALPPDTPYHVRWVVRRCLERDAKMRLRDIGEARVALRTGTPAALEPVVTTPASRPARPLAVAGVLLLGVLVGIAVSMLLRGKPAPAPVRKVDVQLLANYLVGLSPVLSPDGASVLLPTRENLYVRRLDNAEPVALPESSDAEYACWSPDSRQIAFVARGRLWRVAVDGPKPVTVTSLPRELAGAGGLAWLPDDRIVIAGSSSAGLLQVSARGGTTSVYVPLDGEKERDFHEVSILPDGRGLLVSVHPAGRFVDRIDLVRDGKRKQLLKVSSGWIESHVYSSSGHIVYSNGVTQPDIWAVPFSLEKLEVTGEPFLVATNGAWPSVASDGTLSFVRGSRIAMRQLLRVDREGRIERELARPVAECETPDISPDGKRIVASMIEGGSYELIVVDLDTRTTTKLTSSAVVEYLPAWSPDGSTIACELSDRDQIALVSPEGLGESKAITDGMAPRWFSDGKSIAMHRLGEDGSWDLWRHRLDEKKDEPLLVTPANERFAAPSPDGRLVAYVSDETGRNELYVFVPGIAGSKVQVSFNGGGRPHWSAGGRELYFRQGAFVARAKLLAGERVAFGEVERLFSFDEAGLYKGGDSWALLPGGDGFVAVRNVEGDDRHAILTLVTNWAAEFEQKR